MPPQPTLRPFFSTASNLATKKHMKKDGLDLCMNMKKSLGIKDSKLVVFPFGKFHFIERNSLNNKFIKEKQQTHCLRRKRTCISCCFSLLVWQVMDIHVFTYICMYACILVVSTHTIKFSHISAKAILKCMARLTAAFLRRLSRDEVSTRGHAYVHINTQKRTFIVSIER